MYRDALIAGLPAGYRGDLVLEPRRWTAPTSPESWARTFAVALRHAVRAAVTKASGDDVATKTEADRAKDWFLMHFPLLGALAVGFTVVADIAVCRRLDVRIAAVDPSMKEVYVNPSAGLDPDEMRFVLAHELLHVALRHHLRTEGRDAYLWNVACDYVINGWLAEMRVGVMPAGLLYDPELRGLSAEAVYDRICGDLRTYRKLATLRGTGLGDVLGERGPEWWTRGEGLDLDEFYRQVLAQGLELHLSTGRGLLPAGLVEEIRAQSMPPIPWDVQLAQWFDRFFFLPPETRRSYARPSRRQEASPDIPRPRAVIDEQSMDGRTFGVVLDTSGSMDPRTLARALGTIASYCASREVPAVRVVFCDAAAYDEGYRSPEDVAGRVRVRGRGGTILQPGIDLLQKAEDFPKDGPILVITDGQCDHVRVQREHAFLLPAGRRLPFPARGPVFFMGA